MPLPLDDPRWSDLRTSYGDTGNVVAWLRDAQMRDDVSLEWIGDLVNEIRHQGDTTTAMFAVAPHLIELARLSAPRIAFDLLCYAGLIYAESTRSGAASCPVFLRAEFDELAAEGAGLLAPLIPAALDFDTFKHAVAALAGFAGHHPFGRLLSGLEYFDGRFYLDGLDDPLPPEIV